VKLHLGAGTIYLKEYINIDVNPDYLSADAPPDLLEQNTTTFDKYYKHEFCGGSGKSIVDVVSTIDNIPFDDQTADEVVLIQVLEHVPQYKVGNVLCEINRVLKVGGSFIVGVPDVKGLAEMLVKSSTPEEEDWCIRLIHGTQKNPWSHHYCGYTERKLKNVLSLYGFENFKVLENISFYPSVYLKAFKNSEVNK
jgi:ubiquinone/menaquinone biosynthesis C-methylase UbiE